MISIAALALLLHAGALHAAAEPSWSFAVSGDSRNCGDLVMPSIAADSAANHAVFYWHLGDLRAISGIDEDFHARHPEASTGDYLPAAWIDFQLNQIEVFGDMPFFLAIGNHETTKPKTREEFILTFADWLDAPAIREQRLKDDPHDHALRTYYRWPRDGIDFITLDNATAEQFDSTQLAWLKKVLRADRMDHGIRAVVVGMHEALPEGIARGHSMSDAPDGETSGMIAYQALLDVHKVKPVYVLASHSHFVMENVYNTPYWEEHGGVLPGWIIGTAGAVRYSLPSQAWRAGLARTHVYGYLLATVFPRGSRDKDPIQFSFREVTESAVSAELAQRFGSELVHFCYRENARN